MKKLILAGLLALPILGLPQATASDCCCKPCKPCLNVWCPKIDIPIPALPIIVPKMKFHCCGAQGCHHDCGPAYPWYSSFPSANYNYAPSAPSYYGGPYASPAGYGVTQPAVSSGYPVPYYWRGH